MEFPKIEQQHWEGGKKMVEMARADAESRKRSTNNNLERAVFEGTKFYNEKPVSQTFKVDEDAPIFNRKKRECFVCGSEFAPFYRGVKHEHDFCQEHHHMIYWPIEEILKNKDKIKEPSHVN